MVYFRQKSQILNTYKQCKQLILLTYIANKTKNKTCEFMVSKQ